MPGKLGLALAATISKAPPLVTAGRADGTSCDGFDFG
jgi:hypothetical protein